MTSHFFFSTYSIIWLSAIVASAEDRSPETGVSITLVKLEEGKINFQISPPKSEVVNRILLIQKIVAFRLILKAKNSQIEMIPRRVSGFLLEGTASRGGADIHLTKPRLFSVNLFEEPFILIGQDGAMKWHAMRKASEVEYSIQVLVKEGVSFNWVSSNSGKATGFQLKSIKLAK